MLHRVPDLTCTSHAVSGAALPLLSVIVPARNEAADIAATLRSLLASKGCDSQIIAVNDRSTDQTGTSWSIWRRSERRRTRLYRFCMCRTARRAGWGKRTPWRLRPQQATGEWLLFTDGDVLFDPDALRRAFDIRPRQRGGPRGAVAHGCCCSSWAERMMIAFLQVVSIWALRPWRVADPRAKRDAIGVGAFNMIRREVYDASGRLGRPSGWRCWRIWRWGGG